jgi:dipeptidyl aminopeptidase/acylaminoacyl peptidase
VSFIGNSFASMCPALLLAGILAPATAITQCRLDQRRVSVTDAIAMTQLSPPQPESSARPDDPGLFSPDGRHFAVVLKNGDFRNNTNVFRLLIFLTRAALDGSKPEASVTMSSNSNEPGIGDLRWLKDNHTLLFLGEEPNAPAQIYSFDLTTRHLRRLTAQATSVVAFDASDDGRVIVFEAAPIPLDILDTPATRRTGFVVNGEELSTILFSGYRSSQSMAFIGRQLFVMAGPGEPRRVASEDGIWPYLNLSVSPDGRYALVGAMVKHIPPDWALYKEPLLHQVVTARRPIGGISRTPTYLLLDTKTARLSPLLGAPKDWPDDGYLWLDGGRSLVVSHAYLPLDGVTDEERALRERQPFVVELAMSSRRIARIGRDNLTATSWDAADEEITLRGQGNDASIRKIYRRRAGEWEDVSISAVGASDRRPTLSLVQDMNTAPVLWLTDLSGRKNRLLDLNPQFAQLCFGHEQEFAWKATDGHQVRGGLYLPPDYETDRRYPLVIQTHGFDPGQFWIDGPWGSAFAAQPLAARDIVVLQMNYDHVGGHTPEEAPRAMAAIDGAIDFLDKQGIIDPNRVGIIGFSRTVYHVAYTLTHSNHHFVAATLADGFDGDYFQTIAFPVTEGSDAVAVNGGPPYGVSLEKWLEHSPLFSIAAITSPIRLECYGMDSVLGLWSWYSLLSQKGMPVDMVVLPHAPHLLAKPWERIVSQQGNVDWFSFWLKGEEISPLEKRTQYARWQSLRSLLQDEFAKDQVPADH